MKRQRTTPSFVGLRPSSDCASAAARGSSVKTNTRCELVLRRELWRRGMRYRLHHPGLLGRPDIVFSKQRIAIFCDGNFWHGHDLEARLAKLARGHNASYWVAKIRRNVERDHRETRVLEESGWMVLRFWETDVLRETSEVADRVAAVVAKRSVEVSARRSTTSRKNEAVKMGAIGQ